MDSNSIRDKILKSLDDSKQSPADLINLIKTSATTIHKHLRTLEKEGMIEKFGTRPKVYYKLLEDNKVIIRDFFAYQKPTGSIVEGLDGFEYWSKNNLKRCTFEEKETLYVEQINALIAQKQDGLFDFTNKLKTIERFGEPINIEKLFSLSIATLKDFGRTKWYIFLEAAKQHCDKESIKKIVDFSIPFIITYIKKHNVDAVGFVPPTRRRDMQIMNELKKGFNKKSKTVSIINIKKIIIDVPREQKTLKTMQARKENAENTFQIGNKLSLQNFKKILLIDDFVGSGLTLNQIAKEIRNDGFQGKIVAIAIVGEKDKFTPQRIV